MATRKPRAPKTSYVPRVVFTVAVAAVVPSLAPASCGDPQFTVACSMCGVAAVAMGGFGGVGAGGAGGTSPTGTGGGGGTSPTGTGGAGGSGGTPTGTGGTAGGGGTASLGLPAVPMTGFTSPADPRAVDSLADAAQRDKKKSGRAAGARSRRRG
jgi:hypothetical protein